MRPRSDSLARECGSNAACPLMRDCQGNRLPMPIPNVNLAQFQIRAYGMTTRLTGAFYPKLNEHPGACRRSDLRALWARYINGQLMVVSWQAPV